MTAENRAAVSLPAQITHHVSRITDYGEGIMVKANRLPAIIVLFFFVVSMGSCGGGGSSESNSPVGNQHPIISSIEATPPSVHVDNISKVTCDASDPDGDSLTYTWASSGGIISGFGFEVTWKAPSTTGSYSVTCNVSDSKGGSDSKSLTILVGSAGEV